MTKTCAGCGELFGCGAENSEHLCWCHTLQPVVVTDPRMDCFCPNCLRAFIREQAAAGETMLVSSNDMKLIENEDYYLEGGLMVFTAAYHRRRGFCCESNCRHCPYQKERVG